MKLVHAAKFCQQAALLASRTHILQICGKFQIDHQIVLDWMRSDRHIFLLVATDNSYAGICDAVWSSNHRRLDIGMYLPGETEALKEGVRAILNMAVIHGAAKLNLVVDSSAPHSEVLRTFGFIPEVRLRQHAFVGGKLTGLISYGITNVDIAAAKT